MDRLTIRSLDRAYRGRPACRLVVVSIEIPQVRVRERERDRILRLEQVPRQEAGGHAPACDLERDPIEHDRVRSYEGLCLGPLSANSNLLCSVCFFNQYVLFVCLSA